MPRAPTHTPHSYTPHAHPPVLPLIPLLHSVEVDRSKRACPRTRSKHEALGRDLGRLVAAKAIYGSLESVVKLCSLRLPADCHRASYCC